MMYCSLFISFTCVILYFLIKINYVLCNVGFLHVIIIRAVQWLAVVNCYCLIRDKDMPELDEI